MVRLAARQQFNCPAAQFHRRYESFIQFCDWKFSSIAYTGVGNVSGNIIINGTISPGPLGTLNFANQLALSGLIVMEINRTNSKNADLVSAATR